MLTPAEIDLLQNEEQELKAVVDKANKAQHVRHYILRVLAAEQELAKELADLKIARTVVM